MPLAFDERGLLPPGVHDATMDVVREAFGLRHGRRRGELFGNLERFVADVKLAGWDCQVIIVGSFVMPMAATPGDIDIILVVQTDWDFA